MSHHTVAARKTVRDNTPVVVLSSDSNQWTLAIHEQRAGTEYMAVPDAFTFNLRIEAKRRLAWRRKAKVDYVSVFIPCKSKAQVHRMFAPCPLNRVITSFHCS